MNRREEFDPVLAAGMSSAELGAYLMPREQRFVREYLVDLNGTQAAIRSGYKPGKDNSSAASAASRLLRDARILAYRSALIRESVEDGCVSKDGMVLKLLEIWRRCMALEPVQEWDSVKHAWVNSGVWKFDARGAAAALAQLSKLLGYDAPIQVQTTGSGGLELLLQNLAGGKHG